MPVKIESSWQEELKEELLKPYFSNLMQLVAKEYGRTTCFPKQKKIFSAFDFTPFEQVKVVIIGQDPYHGEGQAHGLCFSVPEGIPLPPSLKNIFKELESDLNIPSPQGGNLEHWAKQGVLLLNATLTVQESRAGSHQKKGWETFTDAVIKILSDEREDLVFLLWGGYAKRKGAKIDAKKHCILQCGHPSPLSANRGFWFGNKHFSAANNFLLKCKKEPIKW